MDVVCAHSPSSESWTENSGLDGHYSHDVMMWIARQTLRGLLGTIINDYAIHYLTNRPEMVWADNQSTLACAWFGNTIRTNRVRHSQMCLYCSCGFGRLRISFLLMGSTVLITAMNPRLSSFIIIGRLTNQDEAKGTEGVTLCFILVLALFPEGNSCTSFMPGICIATGYGLVHLILNPYISNIADYSRWGLQTQQLIYLPRHLYWLVRKKCVAEVLISLWFGIRGIDFRAYSLLCEQNTSGSIIEPFLSKPPALQVPSYCSAGIMDRLISITEGKHVARLFYPIQHVYRQMNLDWCYSVRNDN